MIFKNPQISWKLRFYNMLIFTFLKQKNDLRKQTTKQNKKKKEFTSLGNASCELPPPQ